jgi:hypothetical protein
MQYRVRHVVLALALLTAPAFVSAQKAPSDRVKVKVRISTDKEADAKLRPVSMVRTSPNHVMILRSGEFDVRAFGTMKTSLDLYDKNKLTYIRSQEPSTSGGRGSKPVKVDALVFFAGQPMLIGHTFSEEGAAILYQPQTPALTKLGVPYEPLCRFTTVASERMPLLITAGSAIRKPFGVLFSPDSSYMLVHSPEIRDNESKQGLYLMAVIDKEMNVKWQRELLVDEAAKGSSLLDAEIDNKGNAYIVLRNEIPNREAKGTGVKQEIRIYMANGEGVEEATVKFGGKEFASSALLQSTPEGRMICAGIYGVAGERRKQSAGNFVSLFEAGSASLEKPQLFPFSGESLDDESDEDAPVASKGPAPAAAGSKSAEKDKQRLDRNTDLIALVPRTDGGFFLVNELFFIRETIDPKTGDRYISYVHGPMVVRQMDRNGQELWSTIFRRWLSSSSLLIGNVFCAEFDDQLFLFLLDSEEMAERRKKGERITPRHIKNPYSAYVSFDEKGAYRIKPVLRTEKDEDFIGGWGLVRTGPGEYFALGTERLAGGRFLPVKIEFSRDTSK